MLLIQDQSCLIYPQISHNKTYPAHSLILMLPATTQIHHSILPQPRPFDHDALTFRDPSDALSGEPEQRLRWPKCL